MRKWGSPAVALLLGTSLLAGGGMTPVSAAAEPVGDRTVCLDPGHQLRGNASLEPIGPGAKEMKAKVTSGTQGVRTKKPEYVINLEAALLLREQLELYGYKVVMTRDTHDVDRSNRERAAFCNEAAADLALRIHADGNDNPGAKGISMLYPGVNPYTGAIHKESRRAAEAVLPEVLAATGAVSRGAVPRTDLSGFNWSEVPTILVEMGFLTNPEEDALLSDPAYLERMAQGLTAGINRYFTEEVSGDLTERSVQVFLPKPVQLYELSGTTMKRSTLSLTPQLVSVNAAMADWYRIDTWIGERWVRLSDPLIEVENVSEAVELLEDTPLYASPIDELPLATLSSQVVATVGRWYNWYLVSSWLGPVWLKP
jgi:N-acetylmuramoyl-L-alanine amidase